MITTTTDAKPVPRHDNIQLRVAQAWQENTMEKNTPTAESQLSAMGQSDVSEFIESLRTTQDKQALFVLLNQKLRSLPSIEREKFITELVGAIKNSELPEDKNLLKEKFNPAYSMYISADIFANQLNQESLAKMGKMPDSDDEESDDI
ncbi:hypothetical protein [Yersinia hibernica]|nr:hypothetical protein [Yersinia hibernica]